MKKLKIAVIGVGGISVSHINAYLGNPDVELYAFCDINEKDELKGIEKLLGKAIPERWKIPAKLVSLALAVAGATLCFL